MPTLPMARSGCEPNETLYAFSASSRIVAGSENLAGSRRRRRLPCLRAACDRWGRTASNAHLHDRRWVAVSNRQRPTSGDHAWRRRTHGCHSTALEPLGKHDSNRTRHMAFQRGARYRTARIHPHTHSTHGVQSRAVRGSICLSDACSARCSRTRFHGTPCVHRLLAGSLGDGECAPTRGGVRPSTSGLDPSSHRDWRRRARDAACGCRSSRSRSEPVQNDSCSRNYPT